MYKVSQGSLEQNILAVNRHSLKLFVWFVMETNWCPYRRVLPVLQAAMGSSDIVKCSANAITYHKTDSMNLPSY